jgi:hypothetical protein
MVTGLDPPIEVFGQKSCISALALGIEIIGLVFPSLQYFCFWFGNNCFGFLSFASWIANSSCKNVQFCLCGKQILRHG